MVIIPPGPVLKLGVENEQVALAAETARCSRRSEPE